MAEQVIATPSKKFFVSMFTRDIELKDAILDLLDNCVDGILRQLATNTAVENNTSSRPYQGYRADITASPSEFRIEDNCGGIPRQLAKNKAFRLGRVDFERDEGIPTVGMYGIGMKRALFKMGEHATVISRNDGEGNTYYVEITPEWLRNDTDWHLEMNDFDEDLAEDGTSIIITQLHPNIARQFDSDRHTFLSDVLHPTISNFFTLILNKGFEIYLNGERIEPTVLDILKPNQFLEPSTDTPDLLSPYAYKGDIDGVHVELMVGFYRELATPSEVEERTEKSHELPRRSENAGWTVVVNDRVVLFRDKTQVTGWGDGNVPQYHTQFIAIAGVVKFASTDSEKLPLNTSKRGLDMDSQVYWQARKRMMEGLKKFTDFTNHWKGREAETQLYFENMSPGNPVEILKDIPEQSWRTVRGSGGNEQRYSPNLPKPPTESTKRRISFFRERDEIALLGEYFFDNSRSNPSDIGAKCFDEILEKARKEK